MKYRVCKASGKEISAFSLGCMRFPQFGGEAERMVVAAVENGVNLFDTAYIYPGSEKTLGAILPKHGLREKIFIATKLPISMCKKYADFDRLFGEQLRRLKTDYIDYYLMHNISSFAQWEAVRDLGVGKWLAEKKAAGQIRHVGFSYHGSGEEFPRVLEDFSWEFCMLQYNYYDENYQAGRKGVEMAAARGLSVFVMEPLLGGRLAMPPKKAEAVFAAANAEKTPAEWAFDWLWNHEEVTTIFSGTTSTKQLEENIRAADDFTPITLEDTEVFARVVEVFKQSFKIKCTGCNYCLPCPVGIDIPARLSAYNASFAQSLFTGFAMYFTGMGIMTQNPIFARMCNNCGICEKKCPQHLEIRKDLKKVVRRFEPLPIRALLKIVRMFLR